MMRMGFMAALAMLAVVAQGAQGAQGAFAPPPRQALAWLGTKSGESVNRGVVFVDGKFIPGPYKVCRFGNVIGIQVAGVGRRRRHVVQVTGPLVRWEKFLETQIGVAVTNLAPKAEAAAEPTKAADKGADKADEKAEGKDAGKAEGAEKRADEETDKAEEKDADKTEEKDADKVEEKDADESEEKTEDEGPAYFDAADPIGDILEEGAEVTAKPPNPGAAVAKAEKGGSDVARKSKGSGASRNSSGSREASRASEEDDSGDAGDASRGESAGDAAKPSDEAPTLDIAALFPEATYVYTNSAGMVYVLTRPFVKNMGVSDGIREIEERRKSFEKTLKADGFICFGARYVVENKYNTQLLLEKLPDIMQYNVKFNRFRAAINKQGLLFLDQRVSRDLFKHRAEFQNLRKRWEKWKNDHMFM